METYIWTGKTRDGKKQKGELTANSKDDVISTLRKQNIMVTSVASRAKKLSINLSLGSGVTDKDIVVFTRQFATMIDAGLPLIQCLDILAKQTENKRFASAINDIRQNVESGSTYADALKKHEACLGEVGASRGLRRGGGRNTGSFS